MGKNRYKSEPKSEEMVQFSFGFIIIIIIHSFIIIIHGAGGRI